MAETPDLVTGELEALSATLLPSELSLGGAGRSGSLTVGRASLCFQLPQGYPETAPPTIVALSSPNLSPQELRRLQDALLAQWRGGDPVLFDWYRHLADFAETEAAVQMECRICFDTFAKAEMALAGDCGHYFCPECLFHHATGLVNSGQSLGLQCPEVDCQEPVSFHTMKEVLTEATFARFDQALLERALLATPNMVWCPRPACQYPAHAWPGEGLGVCPSCRLAFCLQCSRTYHGVSACKVQAPAVVLAPGLAPEGDGVDHLLRSGEEKDLDAIKAILAKRGMPGAMKFVKATVEALFSSLRPHEQSVLRQQNRKDAASRQRQEDFYGKAFFRVFLDAHLPLQSFLALMDTLKEESARETAPVLGESEGALLKLAEQKTVKVCPSCFVLIEKNGGCNHMNCTHCKVNFDWASGRTW